MKQLLLYFLLISYTFIRAQSVNNGDFNSGSAGWGCNPEINAENVYGGSTSNSVAEVDASAGLCQVISGFTIGSVYRFSLDYSRRTGSCPGPNPANGIITISNGALTANISSTVSGYALQNSVFTFTATQTTLTLNIAANFTGTTCGLIIDNVTITLYSGLPVELLYFKATANEKEDMLYWATASETNNAFFTVERSQDGINWIALQELQGEGNSRERKHYSASIKETLPGMAYYRLKQTDYDGTSEYAQIVAVERDKKATINVFPSPVTNQLTVIYNDLYNPEIVLLKASGEEIRPDYQIEDSKLLINVRSLDAGIYTLKIVSGKESYYKRLVIVKGQE